MIVPDVQIGDVNGVGTPDLQRAQLTIEEELDLELARQEHGLALIADQSVGRACSIG